MTYAFVAAAVLVTLAELGDKTQLLVLGLATRYRASHVLLGVLFGSMVVHAVAVGVGALVGDMLPRAAISVVAGLIFIGFGIFSLRADGDDAQEKAHGASGRFGPVLTVAIAFFIAELGDKTQVMAATIAADPAAVLRTLGAVGPAVADALGAIGLSAEGIGGWPALAGVWAGSVLGMVLADGVAVLAGAAIGHRLSPTVVSRVSGAVFILFGIATLVSAFVG